MAGGRDPWRGADGPSHTQRDAGRDPGRRDVPARRVAEQTPPPPSRRRREPAPDQAPSQSQSQFDARSIFVGPADQDPRSAHGAFGAGGAGGAGGGMGNGAGRGAHSRGARRDAGRGDGGRGDGRRSNTGLAGGLGPGGLAGGYGAAPPPEPEPQSSSSVFAPPAEPYSQPAYGDDPDGYEPWDEAELPDVKSRRSWRQRAFLGAGVVVVMSCLVGAMVAFWVVRTYNSIDRVGDLDLNQVAAGEPKNYLVVGSDSRSGENDEYGDTGGQRSDTIMVLRVDPQSEQAYILSFPRDLQVQIAGSDGPPQRINAAYAGSQSNPQRLIETLQQNFAIPIHHYVEIDFNGFTRLIDHIGGVPLWFDMAVRNPPPDRNGIPNDHDVGLNISELGCVTVQADQALALARSRELQYRTPDGWETDPYGDYGRITRQQIIIRQAMKKAVAQAKANPVQLKGMLELASESVTLDETLGIDDLLDLGERFQDFSSDKLLTFSLPIRTPDLEGKGNPFPNYQLAEPILNAFRGLPIDEVGPTLVSLTVMNGSGEEGQAANVAGAFQQIGFDVTEPGTAETIPRTTVFHAPGQEAYGMRVARHIDGGADVKPRDDLTAGEVELVTGTDFTTVHEEPTPVDEMPPPTGGSGAGAGSTTTASTATTAVPAETTQTTAPAGPPPTTPQVGHTAGQPPPGKTCG